MRVVLAEDDRMLSALLHDFLELEGFVVCGCAATADEAVLLCNENQPDLGVFDYRLATDSRGTTIRPRIDDKTLGVIIASGDQLHDITRDSADLFTQKPFSLTHLGAALRTLYGWKERGAIDPLVLPPGFRLLPERAKAC